MKEREIKRLVQWASIKTKGDKNYKPLTNPKLWDEVPAPVIHMLMELMDDLGIVNELVKETFGQIWANK